MRSTPAESGDPLHRSRASGYNTSKDTRVLGCTAVVNGPPSTFLMPAVYQFSSIHGMGKFHYSDCRRALWSSSAKIWHWYRYCRQESHRQCDDYHAAFVSFLRHDTVSRLHLSKCTARLPLHLRGTSAKTWRSCALLCVYEGGIREAVTTLAQLAQPRAEHCLVM